jgi:hypothetical protein
MFSCEESLIFTYFLLDFFSNNIVFQPFDTFGNLVTNCRGDVKILIDFLFFSLNLAIINLKKRRSYMSNEEKVNVSKNIPLKVKEIICGLMLSDANIRMNGKNALMNIQQTHQELTQEV